MEELFCPLFVVLKYIENTLILYSWGNVTYNNNKVDDHWEKVVQKWLFFAIELLKQRNDDIIE